MDVVLMGVPSAAGAYGASVADAPRALREAGLIERFELAGLSVSDRGDLPVERFTPDPEHPRSQNIDRVVRVASRVADRVADISEQGLLPIILGGDCTITLGVVEGVQRAHRDCAVAYVDGDADVSTPATTRSGILDAMGVAHMLGFDGAAVSLAAMANRVPMVPGRRLAVIGHDESDVDASDLRRLEDHHVHRLPATAIRGHAAQAAAEALRVLDDRDRLIVHFDVDVIDSTELPLAQYPHFNAGLCFGDAMAVLAGLCGAPDVAAIVVTEVNPANDPDGRLMRRLVDGLGDAIGSGLVEAPFPGP
jgi:arginase